MPSSRFTERVANAVPWMPAKSPQTTQNYKNATKRVGKKFQEVKDFRLSTRVLSSCLGPSHAIKRRGQRQGHGMTRCLLLSSNDGGLLTLVKRVEEERGDHTECDLGNHKLDPRCPRCFTCVSRPHRSQRAGYRRRCQGPACDVKGLQRARQNTMTEHTRTQVNNRVQDRV